MRSKKYNTGSKIYRAMRRIRIRFAPGVLMAAATLAPALQFWQAPDPWQITHLDVSPWPTPWQLGHSPVPPHS